MFVVTKTTLGFLDRVFQSRLDRTETERMNMLHGKWVGHYSQYGSDCPIEAELIQEANRIYGKMIDVQTVSERSLSEVTLESGLPPGADEQIDERIRKMLPDAGKEPIRYTTELPEESLVEGVIDGSFIRFEKTYQGRQFSCYRIGNQGVGHVTEDHSVNYSGRVSSDGKTIEGRWAIFSGEGQPSNGQGAFVLHKE